MILVALTTSTTILVFVQSYKSWTIVEYVLLATLFLLALSDQKIFGTSWIKVKGLYWGFFAVAMGVIISEKKVPNWVFLIPLIVISITIIIHHFILEERVASCIFEVNRNRFAMICLTFGLLNTFNSFVKQNIDLYILISPIVVVLLNFYSKSRAGLLSSVIFLVAVVFLYIEHLIKIRKKIKHEKNSKKYIASVVLIIIAISSLTVITVGCSRLGQIGFSPNGRKEIYLSFFHDLTFKKIVFGFRPSILDKFSHVHNSYFQLIAQLGLLSLVFITAIFQSSLYFLKHCKILFLFMGIITLYSFMDHFMFFRPGDLIVFPLIIYAYREKRIKNRSIHL